MEFSRFQGTVMGVTGDDGPIVITTKKKTLWDIRDGRQPNDDRPVRASR
jgi:hypothetical protein